MEEEQQEQDASTAGAIAAAAVPRKEPVLAAPQPVPPPVTAAPMPPPPPGLATVQFRPPSTSQSVSVSTAPSSSEDPRGRTASSSSSTSAATSCGSGQLPKAYYNIKAARASSRSVRIPGGCAAKQYESVGSFAENDKLYSIHGNYRHNYTARQNICTSFTFIDFICNTCTGGEHVALHREGDRIVVSDLSPAAIVLTDQNFPAAVPVDGEGECLKVFRVEDASPQELVIAFLEAARGFVVPAGLGGGCGVCAGIHLCSAEAARRLQGGCVGHPRCAGSCGGRPQYGRLSGHKGLVFLARHHCHGEGHKRH
jgi:hypothetical protein